jgi:LPPG:FO 2-phospho-L-lactate transferase
MSNDKQRLDNGSGNDSIVVVSGGVGAARFLSGLIDAVDPARITAIVNTGDDTVLHGLSISPDLDTITYTLAGATDPNRGWGLVDETWAAMGALERYETIRPAGSSAAPRWFNLGDQDLATHFYRTARLQEGASLTEVTDEIRRAWTIPIRLLPMSDQQCSTVVTTADEGDVSFQDYFVRLRHDVPVSAVRFEGTAMLSQKAVDHLDRAAVVIIAPSNPLVSIAPIRSLSAPDGRSTNEILAARRDSVVAVSPIVGGEALKGPAARMLVELGHDPSVLGVAKIYASIASALVIDPVDAEFADGIEAQGLRCIVTPSVMSTPEIASSLASTTLAAAATI